MHIDIYGNKYSNIQDSDNYDSDNDSDCRDEDEGARERGKFTNEC